MGPGPPFSVIKNLNVERGAAEEDLERTFKKLASKQDLATLSDALADVAKVQEHIPKVVICLGAVVDPFPKEMSHVGLLVHRVLEEISSNTLSDTESFAKVITSFKPSDSNLLPPFAT